jgi:hypothetical protein
MYKSLKFFSSWWRHKLVDLHNSLAEARRGIAPLGGDPIDLVGGGIGPGLDPAMLLLHSDFGDEFGGGSGREVVRDIDFRRRLVALRASRQLALLATILSAIAAGSP